MAKGRGRLAGSVDDVAIDCCRDNAFYCLTFRKPGRIKKGMFALLLNHRRCRSLLIRRVVRLQV